MMKMHGFEATRSDRLSRYGVTATAAIASVTVAGSAGAAIVTSASVGWSAQTISRTGNGPTTGGYNNGGVIQTFGDPLLSAPSVGNYFGPYVSIRGTVARRWVSFNNAWANMSLVAAPALSSTPPRLGFCQPIGATLGGSHQWSSGPWETIAKSSFNVGASGSYGWNLSGTGAASVRGFFAFRIADGSGDYYYGYFDVEVSRTGIDSNSTMSVTIHGWAYNSVAGQLISTPCAVPGGTGLAALAVGAAGLRGRRRSRN